MVKTEKDIIFDAVFKIAKDLQKKFGYTESEAMQIIYEFFK